VEFFDRLLATVRYQWISPAEVRAETWALGVRHDGRPMEGARSELKARDVSVRRAVLLKAVIRSLRH
jgi:hypothetical protein